MKTDTPARNPALLYASPLLATALFLAYSLTSSNVLLALGTLAMFAPFFFASTNDLMILALFYAPNTRMFRIEGGYTLLTFFMVALLLRYLMKKRITLAQQLVFAVLGLFLTVLISSALSNSAGLLLAFLGYAVVLVCLNCFISENGMHLSRLFQSILGWFVAGCLSTVTCGVAFRLLTGVGLLDSRFSGVADDPNYYALVMGFAVSLLLVAALKARDHQLRHALLALVLLIAGGLSISRAYAVSVSINLLVLAAVLMQRSALSASKRLGIAVLVGLSAALLLTIASPVIGNFVERFSEQNVATLNGRSALNARYIELTTENLQTTLFGIGDATRLYEMGVVSQGHHNYYVETFSSLGLIGVPLVLMVYLVLWRMVNWAFRRFRSSFDVLLMFPLLTLAINLLSLGALFRDVHIMILFIWMLQYAVYSRELELTACVPESGGLSRRRTALSVGPQRAHKSTVDVTKP